MVTRRFFHISEILELQLRIIFTLNMIAAFLTMI